MHCTNSSRKRITATRKTYPPLRQTSAAKPLLGAWGRRRRRWLVAQPLYIGLLDRKLPTFT